MQAAFELKPRLCWLLKGSKNGSAMRAKCIWRVLSRYFCVSFKNMKVRGKIKSFKNYIFDFVQNGRQKLICSLWFFTNVQKIISKLKPLLSTNRMQSQKNDFWIQAASIIGAGTVCNLGSKYPYFNRAYVVSSGFGCTNLYLGLNFALLPSNFKIKLRSSSFVSFSF